jgi:cold shock CspA family protein
MPPELVQAVSESGVDMGVEVSASSLEKELRQGWLARKLADMPQGKGQIKNLIGSGNTGFISGDDGQDYFFKAAWYQGPRHLMKPGTRVTFAIEKNPELGKRDLAKYIKLV